MEHPTNHIPENDGAKPFAQFPLDHADQCVKCGLCLPHCPTYRLSRHEGDSPRGRIALMQGLARGDLEPEGKALPHLDGCLVCRACETVCPAQVPYGELIDAGRRGLWKSGHRPGWAWRLLSFWRRTPSRLAWMSRMLRLLHVTRLNRLLASLPLGRVARINRYVAEVGTAPANGPHGTRGGTPVALFLGCIARSLDAQTLDATIKVLGKMDFRVDVPAGQVCCGAMDSHAGDSASAGMLAQRNIAAFGTAGVPVIATASGCGVQLKEYSDETFGRRVHDVMHVIAANAERLPPLVHAPTTVVVHTPCTLKNGMRESGALEVLRAVEGLEVEPLQHRDCCGAAGTYLFEHEESADRLGNSLLDALPDPSPDIFVTSNVGCALHVRRLARERGLHMRVMHPVELLAESMAG